MKQRWSWIRKSGMAVRVSPKSKIKVKLSMFIFYWLLADSPLEKLNLESSGQKMKKARKIILGYTGICSTIIHFLIPELSNATFKNDCIKVWKKCVWVFCLLIRCQCFIIKLSSFFKFKIWNYLRPAWALYLNFEVFCLLLKSWIKELFQK